MTVGLKSVLRDDLSQAQIENVLTTIEQHSLALGILRHVAGLFLNLLASQDPDCDLLFRRTFVQQLFAYIAARGIERRRNLLKHPLLDSFLRENPLPDHLSGIVKNFPTRSADYMAGAMMTSLKESVTRNFQERVEEHAASLLERVWWNEHRSHELFEDVVRKGGRIIYSFIRQSDITVAEQLLEHFLSCQRGKNNGTVLGDSWRPGLFEVASEMREMTKTMRIVTTHPPKKAKLTGYEAFNYSLKSKFNVMLRILRDIREGIGQSNERLTSKELRSRRGRIWEEIDKKQPSLKFSATRCGIECQKDKFRMIRFPQWLQDREEDKLNSEERKKVASLVGQAKRERNRLFKELAEPGTLNPPKGYALLPNFKLQSAFVKYDTRCLNTHFPDFKKDVSPRLWWRSLFDFHSNRTARRKSSAARQSGRRKVLNLPTTWRKGIPMLWKEAWVLNEEEYARRKMNPNKKMPWLVNSIETDGVQVKVLLGSISKESKESPPSIEHLAKKGFESIGGSSFDITKHRRGVFGGAKNLLNELSNS